MRASKFFVGNYQERINSPIITTGNELVKEHLIMIRNAEQIRYSYLREAKRWESSDENRPFIRNYHIFAES